MGIRQLARYPIDSELFNKAALIVAPHPHAINGEIIAKLAPELQEDVLWRAIQHDGVCIKYAPPRLLNKEYCEAAVKSNGIAALYIRELLTPELIECAIKQNPAMLGAFTAQEVGPNYAELAIEACRAGNKTPSKDDPDAVFLFKKAHRGKNQILSMVDPNGLSSEEYEELCAAAVAANPENIKYVQYPLCRAEVYGALLFGLW